MARTYLERERSQSTRGEYTSTSYDETSLERERLQSHVESSHPQGAVPTSLERETTTPHVESQAQSATGSSDALAIESRRSPTASRGRTYALSAEATQARERSGEARETPAQAAEGPGLQGRRGIPDRGCSHPAQRHRCRLTWGRAGCPRWRLTRFWPRRTRRQYSGL
jgi:hypothetical protein